MTKTLTITLAAVAAALVAATAATATSKGTDDHRRRQHLRLAARLGVDAGSRLGVRLQPPVQRRRLGRRIAAVTSRQVDFGASDAPLTPDQATACKSCVQIPWALSATSVAYNVPGAPVHLNLDGKTISKIFLGQITNWNDPAIKALNKGANLPDLKITPDLPLRRLRHDLQLHRLPLGRQPRVQVEGRQLDRGQPSRQASAHAAPPAWQASSRAPTGAITYVDVAFALKNHIKFAAVRNAAGKFLFPSLRRIQAAAAAVHRRCRRPTRCTS